MEHTADRILVLHKDELIRDTTPYATRGEETVNRYIRNQWMVFNFINNIFDVFFFRFKSANPLFKIIFCNISPSLPLLLRYSNDTAKAIVWGKIRPNKCPRRQSDKRRVRVESVSDNFYQHALTTFAVELTVEDLLSRPEIELSASHGYDHLT